jgi:His-Xaa-Ser system protein HxsD
VQPVESWALLATLGATDAVIDEFSDDAPAAPLDRSTIRIHRTRPTPRTTPTIRAGSHHHVPEIIAEFGPSQSIGALREAAYRLIADASCTIDTIEDRHVCRLIPKEKAGRDPADIRARFLDLVTDQNLREKVSAETTGIRNVIVALAFGALARERDGSVSS